MPDGNDIVTRLRVFNHHLMVEAADEIERLRQKLYSALWEVCELRSNGSIDDATRIAEEMGLKYEGENDPEDADANNEHFRTTDGE
jgi:hypothetical protein